MKTPAVEATAVDIDRFLMRLDYSASTTLDEVARDMEYLRGEVERLQARTADMDPFGVEGSP
jgi:hypothetical protein